MCVPSDKCCHVHVRQAATTVMATAKLSARERLGEDEWRDRLERMLGLVDAGREEAEQILDSVDGHVGHAVAQFDCSQHSCCQRSCCQRSCCQECQSDDLVETLARDWWNNRFREDGSASSDWLLNYEGYGNFITRHLSETESILVPGCGNSPFSAKLYADGFHQVHNTDISDYVIGVMSQRHADPIASEDYCDGMSWEVDDATAMRFEDGSFDQIVDKSLLDCMTYCDEEDFGCIPKFLQECFRVLKPGGLLVVATKMHVYRHRDSNRAGRDSLLCLHCRNVHTSLHTTTGSISRADRTILHEHTGGEENASHWCGLDWTVNTQVLYVPDDEDGVSGPAVATREELPEGSDYQCFYIYTIRKWRVFSCA